MAQEIEDSTLLDTWSSGGLKVKPDVSKIIEGWQLGEQPPHEYMNWLQNTFGSKLNHILKNGVASWNNKTQNLAGATAQHNGNVWLCKTTNTNSAPTDANANWKRIITVEALTTVLAGYVTTTGNETIAGVKTFSSNPISSATQSTAVNALTRKDYVDTKAPLASPVFTGTPTAPTPTAGDNSTKVATTAFVLANQAPTNLGITAGTIAGPIVTSSTGTNATLPTASGTASGVVTTGNQTIAGIKTFTSTISGSISGNAGTATKLQAAITINGESFDGSANITVSDATAVKLTGNQTIAGVKTFSSSLIVSGGTEKIRFIGDGYGSYFAQGSGKLFLFLTNKDDEYGTLNTYRPLIVDLASGICNISGNSETVTGGVYTVGNQTIAGIKTFSSSPVVPTPTANTEAANKAYVDSKVALADFTGANQSKTTNGYQKLPGGVILQWGFTLGTTTVTFPIAFPIVCSGVQLTHGPSGTNLKEGSTSSVSKTSFVTLGSGSDGYMWFAIGY